MERQVLSLWINTDLYLQLKTEIGRGNVSNFVEQLITKELSSQENKLTKEYQEVAQDKKRWVEAKEWEKAQMSDWNKWDDGENN